ncbi:MAG: hypothetical protein JO041_05125 [Acidobacteria bacterium]|nr:hypothetical protein [Acidobacteriota bacterium]
MAASAAATSRSRIEILILSFMPTSRVAKLVGFGAGLSAVGQNYLIKGEIG